MISMEKRMQPFNYEPNKIGPLEEIPKMVYYDPFCFFCKHGSLSDQDFTCRSCQRMTSIDLDFMCLHLRKEIK